MTLRVRGADRRRVDDGSRTGPNDRRRGERRRCSLEPLEQRQLMAGDPLFVGPLPGHSNPQTGYLAPGGGPSSELRAVNLTASSNGSYTFEVVYRDDGAVRAASIDSLDVRVYGPNGYARTATLIGIDRPQDGPVRVARYKVAPPGGSWGVSDNGRYRVELRPGQVFDVSGNAANDGIIGEFYVSIPGATAPLPAPIRFGVDVRDFGAIPNDNLDDTAAIQAAIDSLPKGVGVPVGARGDGGVVLLPAGVFDVSRPLKLSSGITLRGAGSGATVIHGVSADRNSSAIQLYSPFVHRWNIGVTVEHLSIYTRWSRGITIDPNMNGDVNDLHLNNLRISSLGAAIDLRDQAVFHTDIDNVEVYNPGSTALHLGRYDGVSYVNRVRDFRVTGRARSGFRPETALVYVSGDTLVQGMTITVSGARVLPLYLTGRATFSDLRIDVPLADNPGGYAARLHYLHWALFDSITNVGMGRRLLLTEAYDVQVKQMTSDGTSNILSRLAKLDPKSSLRVGNEAVGRLQLVPPPNAPAPHLPVPAPTNVIDATRFGVVPTDLLDDTAALQAAIDSLPKGDGIPGGGGGAVGGIIQLPQGDIHLSAAIKLPSGVWLRGHGNGTALRNDTLDFGRAVIELTSPYTHRANVGAGLIDLGIYSRLGAGGVRADESVEGELRDLRLIGLRMTTGGPGIDLRTVQVSHARIERVVVHEPGSTPLWLGRADNSSTGNLVRAFRVSGNARPGYVEDEALVLFYGDTRIESGAIEGTHVEILPFYASGKLHMLDFYEEYPQQPDNVGFVFDNVQGYIDNFFHLDPHRRMHFINGSRVEMGVISLSAYDVPLLPCISVDASSRLVLNGVIAVHDAGLLDHPRVTVRGVYSLSAQRFIDTPTAMNGTNLLADPDMTDVADDREADWTIYWGNTPGSVTGTWSVETVGGYKRLKLVVHANPGNDKVSVRIKLDVPDAAVGRPGISRWRVDGDGQVFAYTYGYAAQYQARVTRSLTAMKSPSNLAAGEQLWIDIAAARGTYYLWKVATVAA